MSLVPTIYTTLRVFWLGNMPGDWSYSIAGQLSWVNLIYEVVSEAIILPLFYFTGQTLMDKKEFANRIKTGLAVVLSVYRKYGRRAGNLLGCEQLYLGMAFTSDIEPGGFD